MEAIALSKKEIAESFSTGKFENTFPYLSEDVVWRLVGDSEIVGKSEVVLNCQKTTAHHDLVQNIFTTEEVIKDHNKVVIRGKGEFIRKGKRVKLLAACDVYEFNDKDQVKKISSFCIEEKN
jgi:hypothetical protein